MDEERKLKELHGELNHYDAEIINIQEASKEKEIIDLFQCEIISANVNLL